MATAPRSSSRKTTRDGVSSKATKPVYEAVLELPPLPADQYDALRSNVALNGVLVPILVDSDGPRRRIIDGNHRKQVADELGYVCPEIVKPDLSDQEKRTLARMLNLARRQLDQASKRALIADQLRDTPRRSDRWVAKQLGVSHPTVASVRQQMEVTGKIFHCPTRIGVDERNQPAHKPAVNGEAGGMEGYARKPPDLAINLDGEDAEDDERPGPPPDLDRSGRMGWHEPPYRGQTDVWLTPRYVLDALGTFDLDPCAPAERPWETARTHYTEADDALHRLWIGRVYLNPPYGPQTQHFLRRLAEHGDGIALTYARTETSWFAESVWGAASALLFLRGRVRFCRADGTPAGENAVAPSVLIAYDPPGKDSNREALRTCGLDGTFVPLDRPSKAGDLKLPQAPKPIRTAPRSEAERRARIDATALIHGDCREALKSLPDASVDAVVTDPIYPEVDREYGRITEADWHDLMRVVVAECRRLLKPKGSMVVVIQPNYERVGRMRLWPWEFLLRAGREWNLVQDAYWWAVDAMPLTGTNRKQGLMRHSVKLCVWLGPPDCYRNQDNVLWTPSETTSARNRADMAMRTSSIGRTYRNGRIAGAADERGGTTPFNLLPVAVGAQGGTGGHPAATPYDVAAWWCRYLLPEGGVLLDPFCGSGTMLQAALDHGASRVIGIEKEAKYLEIARRRISGG
ncbi:DNA N-6-adenine-methyltransferase [Tautonia plasticadhaerens]|uniref:Modification methylase PvuII n=1 Tax=Tautonia plasticadhaerens TaxID=2527974 RepID=A0A518H9R0_9BACT|nr:DNA N-6-adenine-methyltransferase [Tautonia plasticadhaerens]QDV37579.1 Modification methylase PvuII [Tautonia plasticadhaerens]